MDSRAERKKKCRRRSILFSRTAALLLLLFAILSLPFVVRGDGVPADDRFLRKKKRGRVAKCIRRIYVETRHYLRCAWPLSSRAAAASRNEGRSADGGGDDAASSGKQKTAMTRAAKKSKRSEHDLLSHQVSNGEGEGSGKGNGKGSGSGSKSKSDSGIGDLGSQRVVGAVSGSGSGKSLPTRGKGRGHDDSGYASSGMSRSERLDACGSYVDDTERRGRCLAGRTSAASVDRIMELCRAADFEFRSCLQWAKKYVDYSAGQMIGASAGTYATEPPPDEEALLQARSLVSGRRTVVPWRMRPFNTSIVDGYASCDDFEADIEQAFLMLADSVIRSSLHNNFDDKGKRIIRERPPVFKSAPQNYAQPAKADDSDGDPKEEESSFGTNTQEEEVDEADVVKVRGDGKLAFAAYGDLIFAWDTVTGDIRARTKVRTIESGLNGSNCHYNTAYSITRARVQSLLIDGDRLVAIVRTGYYNCRCWYCTYNMNADLFSDEPLLSDYAAIQIRVYDISDEAMPDPKVFVLDASDPENPDNSDPTVSDDFDLAAMELALLDSADLQGRLMSARSIGSTAHVVTESYVKDYKFTNLFYLGYYGINYEGLNATEYAEAARAKALTFAPMLARKLVEEVLAETGTCSGNFVRLSSLGMPSSSDELEESGGDGADHLLGSLVLLGAFVRINSFDFALPKDGATNEVVAPLSVAMAGCFLPTSYAEMYASVDYLILSGRLYNRFGSWPRDWWEDYTYLFAFKLSSDGSAARFVAVGTLPGYTLNQFSFDEYMGYLRVATSSNERLECVNYTTYGDGSYAYTSCARWRTVSKSTSQVTVLRLPAEGSGADELELMSEITGLGETERIFAVRFFDERAFVVTFRQTDPLYSIDFSNASRPVLADELKVSGFSRYLHPIGTDLLLSVGQDADENTGRQRGLQISLYDVSDLYNISLVTRYNLDESNTGFSFSDAEFDHRAFRYLSRSGWLLIPASNWNYKSPANNFDGFLVFEVKREEIVQLFNVTMLDDRAFDSGGCYYYARMSPRTLVFEGNATFIKSHSYQSWDISEKEYRWDQSLDLYLTEEECKPY